MLAFDVYTRQIKKESFLKFLSSQYALKSTTKLFKIHTSDISYQLLLLLSVERTHVAQKKWLKWLKLIKIKFNANQ